MIQSCEQYKVEHGCHGICLLCEWFQKKTVAEDTLYETDFISLNAEIALLRTALHTAEERAEKAERRAEAAIKLITHYPLTCKFADEYLFCSINKKSCLRLNCPEWEWRGEGEVKP